MLVDLKSAGGLRALTNFVSPLMQVLTVLNVYALARLSGRVRTQGVGIALRRAILFPAVSLAVMFGYLGVIVPASSPVEHLMYGGKWRALLHLMPLLGLSALMAGLGGTFSTLLRAAQNSQHQFLSGLASTAAGLLCGLLLLRPFGVAGALWAMVIANAAAALVIIVIYVRILERNPAAWNLRITA
jgi:O-antigen/teichoic acid export membrane protein